MTAIRVSKFGARLAGAAAAFVALCAMPTLASAQAIIRDAEIEDTLRVYDTPVLHAANIRTEDVRFYVVQDPSINAFVSSGQNIFVHTGLIMAAHTPNEIIAVMAHETGHIAGGHLSRASQAQANAMPPALISIGLGILALAAGQPGAGAALISGAPAFAMGSFVRFTQVEESSADQAGMTFLEESGQSGRGLISFFDRELRPYEFLTRRVPPYMLTHPYTSDRVEALRRRVESAAHRDAPDTPDNIRRFQFMQAKLVGFIQTQGQTLARYPLSDHSQPARYARAIAYYRASDLANARSELDSLIAEDPHNPYFQELMGQILFENAHAAEAVPYYRRAVQYDPGQPLLQVGLARAIDAAQGRAGTDEAIGLLQQAVAREPDNGYAWREMAQAREMRGEEGLANLASAEESFSIGDYALAGNFAERARRVLPHNTPAYQRATDIVTFVSQRMEEQMRRHGGQGGGN
jgi:predicted Zn-dependent protease